MKTNYANLTGFEASVIVAAIIGLVLIGFEIFITLPQQQKLEVADAFTMFDMHEDFSALSGNAQFVADTTQNFFDEFYIAFTEIFSFPDQIGTPVLKFASGLQNYSTSIAADYQMNAVESNYNAGQVLGAMLIRESAPVNSSNSRSYRSTQRLNKQYYYHAPEMVQKLLK